MCVKSGRCPSQPIVPDLEHRANVLAQCLELGDVLLDLLEFLRRQRSCLSTWRIGGAALLQQLRDLLDREAEAEGGADDADAFDGPGRKPSIAVRQPLGARDHATLFVMANRVGADPADPCDLCR